MEKLEGLSFEQFVEAKETAKAEGYNETQTVENVPVGAASGRPHTINVKVNGKVQKSANFCIVPFVRKSATGEEVKLIFTAVKYDVTHMSSGKSYNGILTKATEELIEQLKVPANLSKDTLFDSVAYGTTGRTILKFQSIG